MAAPRVPIDALPEQTAVVGSDLLVVQNGATTKKMAITTLGNGVGVPTGGSRPRTALVKLSDTCPASLVWPGIILAIAVNGVPSMPDCLV